MNKLVSLDNRSARRGQRSWIRGQGTVEYALIITLVAVVAIAALLSLGGGVTNVLASVTDALGPVASGPVPSASATPGPTAKPTATPKPTRTPKPTKAPKPTP